MRNKQFGKVVARFWAGKRALRTSVIARMMESLSESQFDKICLGASQLGQKREEVWENKAEVKTEVAVLPPDIEAIPVESELIEVREMRPTPGKEWGQGIAGLPGSTAEKSETRFFLSIPKIDFKDQRILIIQACSLLFF